MVCFVLDTSDIGHQRSTSLSLSPTTPHRYAHSWGNIHVVSCAWLEDSLRLGVRQDEAKYVVRASQPSSRSKGRVSGGRDSVEPQHARCVCVCVCACVCVCL